MDNEFVGSMLLTPPLFNLPEDQRADSTRHDNGDNGNKVTSRSRVVNGFVSVAIFQRGFARHVELSTSLGMEPIIFRPTRESDKSGGGGRPLCLSS